MGIIKSIFGTYSQRELKRIEPIKQAVLDLEPKYKEMTDKDLKAQTGILKERLANGETLDDILPDAFAACREASARVIGIRHYPVQIIGGIVLHQGRIAEMRTGEGKTFISALPAYLNALTGKGVHVVTVNDYLAKRDSELIAKVHRFMGLTVGLITHDLDNDRRRAAYACDVTYATNNELGFDYLRDNMCIFKKDLVMRGYNFAIVDEVDSILIDEARTPLIISGQGDKSTELYEKADKFAKTLKKDVVTEIDTKEEYENNFDGDYLVDEKEKTCNLLPAGVAKAEAYFNVENLMDPENITLLHHINQAIRANGIMKLNVDYIIKDGEVVIVDEFTGRLMFGRRYNAGLHQAIEAKEGVKVMHESKTLASITFQNFFRLYTKLSGMTGTAMTEESEFRQIYSLDVVEIPTNRPVIRKDNHDKIYKNTHGKLKAVCDQVEECHKRGQPVLVGTVTIEKSEQLSKLLKARGIKHEVLNAKNHEREADIVAQAGKKNAVTIATNMAGRGTDIKLGGNSEYLALAEMRKLGYSEGIITEATGFAETDNIEIISAREKFQELVRKFDEQIKPEAEAVREAGGLYIIGTERHESRRIDNQLRGRAGRQGDPGESCFYISLEDDLMRLFGGERVQTIMEKMNFDEDLPLEVGFLSKAIESAQMKIEGNNFAIRKHVLDFDDVMSQMRQIIYSQRQKVLDGEDIHDNIISMMNQDIEENVKTYCSDSVADNWNLDGLRAHYANLFLMDTDLRFSHEELNEVETKDVMEFVKKRGKLVVELREKDLGPENLREIERVCLLKVVDKHWMDHIDAMDELKNGIGLRSYAQRNPVEEYRFEGFNMFDEMIATIREETVRLALTIPVKMKPMEREQVMKPDAPNAGSNVPYRSEKRAIKKATKRAAHK